MTTLQVDDQVENSDTEYNYKKNRVLGSDNAKVLSKDVGTMHYDELWPVCQDGDFNETDAKNQRIPEKGI